MTGEHHQEYHIVRLILTKVPQKSWCNEMLMILTNGRSLTEAHFATKHRGNINLGQ